MKEIKSDNYKRMKKKALMTQVSEEHVETTLTDPSDIEFNVDVYFSYTPSTPDVTYLPNGDPGYPGSGPEWDIKSVVISDGPRAGQRLTPDEEVYYSDQIDNAIEDWQVGYEPHNPNDEYDPSEDMF